MLYYPLYQLPRTPFSQNTYHQLLLSCEYCKVFKNGIFMEHFREQSFVDVLQSFANLTGNHLCWSLFLKNQQATGTLLKKTPTKVLSSEVCEIFNEHLFYKTPLVSASASPVAASVFFKKVIKQLSMVFRNIVMTY